MIGSDVSPFVEVSQVSQPSVICRVVCCHREAEAEAVEVLLQIVDVRIPAVELSVGRELLLHQYLQGWSNLGGDDLGAFSVEVATIALKLQLGPRFVMAIWSRRPAGAVPIRERDLNFGRSGIGRMSQPASSRREKAGEPVGVVRRTALRACAHERIHERLELGTRPEGLDVGVGLDLLGELGVGVDHLAEQHGGAAEITLGQAIALGLRRASHRCSTS